MEGSNPSPIPFITTPFTKDWTFKRGNLTATSESLAANDLPTVVHLDLLKQNKIPDPFLDLNELSTRWVGDETWTYSTTFAAPPNHFFPNVTTVLMFEGLDTFASVYLNGNLVLSSDNMFVEHRMDVGGKLKSTDNTLEIVFMSARKKGFELVEQHKENRFIVHQTEVSRGPVRKAQYHWGWDWGPILLTCGPWKPISIETFASRIFDLWAQYELTEDMKEAEVRISVEYEGYVTSVSFDIVNQRTSETVASAIETLKPGSKSGRAEVVIKLDNFELWYPRTYGPQTLYTIYAHAQHTFASSPSLFHPTQSLSQPLAFRKVKLIRAPDSHGTSFYLRINNIDVFIGGSCWIPASPFLPHITPQKYTSWVELAARGNQNMLRVWGGGIYEDDAFYDAADQLGVLVWQDFGFACASYPAYPAYLESVEREARQNVRRLRCHPSLVIWAGNNEDYQIVDRYDLTYDVENKDPGSWLKTDFPARYIYEHLLPTIIDEECPGVPYHPGSPFGNGTSTVLDVDPTIGDVHQWNVWHGSMQPYQRLPDMGGRFVSEFGMQAYPHVSTLESCITREEARYPGSMMMDFRNKAIGHERRLISYVAENFRIRYDLEGFTHLTQIVQADAMACAYKGWRRQWNVPGERKCGGVLVWQLNDCWPTISWSVVDYHLVPKPAFYAIKRAMEPVVVGVQRKFKSWTVRGKDELWQRDTGHVDMRKIWERVEFDVWVANSTCEGMDGYVVVRFWCVESGREVKTALRHEVEIMPNGTTEVIQGHVIDIADAQGPDEPFNLLRADPFAIHASLYVGDQCVAIDISWPDPIKYLSFRDRGVEIRYPEDGTRVSVSAAKPVKGFVFCERPGMSLSDNGFDIMPGEEKEVRVTGCKADELKWRYVEMQDNKDK